MAVENQQVKSQLLVLQEHINLLLHKRYGARSEKAVAGQFDLFNEAEQMADTAHPIPTEEENLSIPAHTRKKPGRKPLPPGKPATSKSYMWVQKGGPPDAPLILYDYDPSRSQNVRLRLLHGFQGYLQTDGYDGYAAVCAPPDIIRVGCWAHAQRKFDEAVKAQGTHQPKAGKATQGLAYIQKLYRLEALIKDDTPDSRYQVRQEKALPLLADLRTWLDHALLGAPPTSATGKALRYLHNQWDTLIRYTDDGRLNIDNNPTERAIRPFVTGRKNSLIPSMAPTRAPTSTALSKPPKPTALNPTITSAMFLNNCPPLKPSNSLKRSSPLTSMPIRLTWLSFPWKGGVNRPLTLIQQMPDADTG